MHHGRRFTLPEIACSRQPYILSRHGPSAESWENNIRVALDSWALMLNQYEKHIGPIPFCTTQWLESQNTHVYCLGQCHRTERASAQSALMGLRDSTWCIMGPKILLLKIDFYTFCGSEIGTGKRDTFTLLHIEVSPEMIPECGTDFGPDFQARF